MVFINAKYSEDTFIRIIFKTENNCTPLFSKFFTELLDDSVHVSKRNPCVWRDSCLIEPDFGGRWLNCVTKYTIRETGNDFVDTDHFEFSIQSINISINIVLCNMQYARLVHNVQHSTRVCISHSCASSNRQQAIYKCNVKRTTRHTRLKHAKLICRNTE